MAFITILTPTFNRAYTLRRLYDSLCKQSDQSVFEWIVVDDGSVDNTRELVQTCIHARQGNFAIQYFYQINSGKHVAVNYGVSKATGQYILILDSDELLVEHGIKIIIDRINANTYYGAYCFRKALLNNEIIGKTISSEVGDSLVLTPNQAARLMKGDLAYIFQREVLQANPFPVFPGEKFVPELYIWNQIADQHQILFFPAIILILTEYLPDGYSQNFKKNLRANPRGFLLFYFSQIKRNISVFIKLKCGMRILQCIYFIIYKKLKLYCLKVKNNE